MAVDRGEPALSTLTSVDISLGDVNDNAPMFDRNSYSVLLQV